jgi:tetratricopeptide (TPR) repeat protein
MRSKRLVIIALGVILASCHQRPRGAVVPPPVIVPIVVPVAAPVPVAFDIPASLPTPVQELLTPAAVSLLEKAELAFVMGDYAEAIEDYENYLRSFPDGDRSDQALFRVGMAYILRTKPPANWTRGTASLKRLVKEHPDSPVRQTAALILSLRSHADQLARDAKARNEVMQQLNTELERLKKIDADRRKHP